MEEVASVTHETLRQGSLTYLYQKTWHVMRAGQVGHETEAAPSLSAQD